MEKRASSPVNSEEQSGICKNKVRLETCFKEEFLEHRVDADGTSGHMLDLAWHVFTKADLVLGQHFEDWPKFQPPLLLGHSVPEEKQTRMSLQRKWPLTELETDPTHSKSVIAFSSVTGMNEMTFLLKPSTHAVSDELANTWSGGVEETYMGLCCGWCPCSAAGFTPQLYLAGNFRSISVTATGWPWPPAWCQNSCQRAKVLLPGGKGLAYKSITRLSSLDVSRWFCTCWRCPNTLNLQSKMPFPSDEYSLWMKSVV